MSDISRPPNNGKIFTRKLINTITQSKKNAVYSSSQQERGDLGSMMVPKVFLRAREKFAKELVSNRNEEIILLDDDETV